MILLRLPRYVSSVGSLYYLIIGSSVCRLWMASIGAMVWEIQKNGCWYSLSAEISILKSRIGPS